MNVYDEFHAVTVKLQQDAHKRMEYIIQLASAATSPEDVDVAEIQRKLDLVTVEIARLNERKKVLREMWRQKQ